MRKPAAAVEELASRYGDALQVVRMDVSKRASVDAVAAEVAARAGELDLLICNAGVNPSQAGEVQDLSQVDDRDMLDTFNVNVVGPLRLVRALLPLLRSISGAKIVVISSGAGSLELTSSGAMIAYCVSKAAVNMLTRRLHFALDRDAIPVLALSPGWVKTDMGGPDAKISVEESADGIVKVIAAYDREAPPFQDYTGKPQPW